MAYWDEDFTEQEIEQRLQDARVSYQKELRDFWVKEMPRTFALGAIIFLGGTWMLTKSIPELDSVITYLISIVALVFVTMPLVEALRPKAPSAELMALGMMLNRVGEAGRERAAADKTVLAELHPTT